MGPADSKSCKLDPESWQPVNRPGALRAFLIWRFADILRAEHIIFEFRSEFPGRASKDRLLRSVRVDDFVVTVLVPELAVMLIKEDMKVGDQRAREILQESAALGEILCEDE
jgi:hypothetical protein